MSNQTTHWDIEITPKPKFFSIDFKEIWRYRDLLFLFVKREIVQVYKQTVLGPLWFFIQPILTTIMYTFVFGNIAGISTDGQPKVLFYLSGILLWTYFSDAVNNTSNTFTANASIFGKVYFPRMVMPLSKVISNLLKFGIQAGMFIAIYLYLLYNGNVKNNININILLLPLLLVIVICLGLGIGMTISALTTKYKDLSFLIGIAMQLLMYASPVIYSLETIQQRKPQYFTIISYNPISPVIETFRKSILGGTVNYGMLLYSFIVSILVLFLGMLFFSKTEKSFIDTV